MKILFVNTDYGDFLHELYQTRGLGARPYEEQMAARNASLFGVADFMTEALNKLGHNSTEIHVNNRVLQQAWVIEQKKPSLVTKLVKAVQQFQIPSFVEWDPRESSALAVMHAQISKERPDVIINYDPSLLPPASFAPVREKFGALVAQIAAPIDEETDWRGFDLILSSLPNYIAKFAAMGAKAAYLPLYFAPRVLQSVIARARDIEASFIGSITNAHASRKILLEEIAAREAFEIWGAMARNLPNDSPLRALWRGQAWGQEMYSLLARSKLTLNKHIDIAEGHSNNMRLFEATGMGACLITDHGVNLSSLFEPGREVLTYSSAHEAADLLRHYRRNETESRRIAEAGQRRCLLDHNVDRRAEQMIDILRRHL